MSLFSDRSPVQPVPVESAFDDLFYLIDPVPRDEDNPLRNEGCVEETSFKKQREYAEFIQYLNTIAPEITVPEHIETAYQCFGLLPKTPIEESDNPYLFQLLSSAVAHASLISSFYTYVEIRSPQQLDEIRDGLQSSGRWLATEELRRVRKLYALRDERDENSGELQYFEFVRQSMSAHALQKLIRELRKPYDKRLTSSTLSPSIIDLELREPVADPASAITEKLSRVTNPTTDKPVAATAEYVPAEPVVEEIYSDTTKVGELSGIELSALADAIRQAAGKGKPTQSAITDQTPTVLARQSISISPEVAGAVDDQPAEPSAAQTLLDSRGVQYVVTAAEYDEQPSSPADEQQLITGAAIRRLDFGVRGEQIGQLETKVVGLYAQLAKATGFRGNAEEVMKKLGIAKDADLPEVLDAFVRFYDECVEALQLIRKFEQLDKHKLGHVHIKEYIAKQAPSQQRTTVNRLLLLLKIRAIDQGAAA